MSALAEPTLEAPTAATPGEHEASPLSEAMAELEALDSPEPPAPKPKAPARPPVEKPEKAVKTEKVEQPKAKETPKEAPKAPEKPESEPKTNPELRAAYEKAKTTLKEREAEFSKFKQEIEARSKTPVEDKEKTTLLERVSNYEKRIKELTDKERLLDYKGTEEFQTKYWKPYAAAVSRAVSDLEEVTFNDSAGNPQKVDSNLILWLAGQKPAVAERKAQELFGEAGLSRLVTDRIDKIRDAADQMNEAVTEHQKSAETSQKEQQAKMLEMREKIGKLWESENNSWQERFPNWFKPKDGDDEGNALLHRGYELVNKAFSANGAVSPEERVKLHAEVRNKAAAFPRMALRLKQTRERVAELEKELAEYRKSEPPAGDTHRESATEGSDPYMDAMDELEGMK